MEEVLINIYTAIEEFVHNVGPFWAWTIVTAATAATYGIGYGIYRAWDSFMNKYVRY